MEKKVRKKPGPKKGFKKKEKKAPIPMKDQLRAAGMIINDRAIGTPDKHAGGRPTKLTPEMQARAKVLVEEVMHQGGSALEVAFRLGISRETLYDWKKVNKEFSDTISKGIMAREVWMENQAVNNFRNKEYNTPLFTLYAMNSIGWSRKDKSETNVTVSTAEAVQQAANKRMKRIESDD